MPELAALSTSLLIRTGRKERETICIYFQGLRPTPSMPVLREEQERRKGEKPSKPQAGEGKPTLPRY